MLTTAVIFFPALVNVQFHVTTKRFFCLFVCFLLETKYYSIQRGGQFRRYGHNNYKNNIFTTRTNTQIYHTSPRSIIWRDKAQSNVMLLREVYNGVHTSHV